MLATCVAQEEVRQEKEALDLMVKLKDLKTRRRAHAFEKKQSADETVLPKDAAEKKAFQDARSLEKKATKIAKERCAVSFAQALRLIWMIDMRGAWPCVRRSKARANHWQRWRRSTRLEIAKCKRERNSCSCPAGGCCT